jgi:glycosyltransferase involved in cell wall biosynthesis
MCEIGLTAVIPIRRIDESTCKLKGVVVHALECGIEVILVIDSQDRSERIEIINHFRSVSNDSFKIVESNKESPGEARNVGMALSERPYVTFWDADDIPAITEVVETLNRLSAEPNKKYGIGSFEVIEPMTAKVLSRHILMEQTDSLGKLFENPGIWRWIFQKENIQNTKFQKFRMGEDQDFIADLNPKLDEIILSSFITYRYVKGWSRQLTKNQSALNELSQSIQYLAEKVSNGKANVWHRKFLLRQILTAVKRGSVRVKFQAIIDAARIALNYVK